MSDHSHCPYGCDHPQPFLDDMGQEWCGRCWNVKRTATRMVLCSDAICVPASVPEPVLEQGKQRP